jgi:hypothetical protein
VLASLGSKNAMNKIQPTDDDRYQSTKYLNLYYLPFERDNIVQCIIKMLIQTTFLMRSAMAGP